MFERLKNEKEYFPMRKRKLALTSAVVALAMALSMGLTACSSASTASPAASSEAPASSAAVASEAESTSDHYPVTITNYNYAGEEVTYTYDKAPEKVIAVYQGSIETMIALGLEDHVVASYGLDNEVKDEWKAGFEKMNYHDDVFAPDKETVTLLEPDMILSWGSIFSDKKLGDVADWNAKGVATYMNTNTRPGGYARTLENEYTDRSLMWKIRPTSWSTR